jgi:hypothetical protein
MPPGFSVGRLARARIGPAEGSKTLRLELQDRPLGRALQPYRVHGVQPLAQLVGSWAAVGDARHGSPGRVSHSAATTRPGRPADTATRGRAWT